MKYNYTIFSILHGIFLLSLLQATASDQPYRLFVLDQKVQAVPGFECDSTVFLRLDESQRHQLLRSRPDHLVVEIPLSADGQRLFLELDKGEVLQEEGAVMAVTEHGEQRLSIATGVHYRGHVADDSLSIAAISVFPDDFMGLVSMRQHAGNYNLVRVKTDPSGNLFAFYSDAALKNRPTLNCFDAVGGNPVPMHRGSGQGNTSYSTKCVRIQAECDYYTFSVTFGSNSTAVSNYISSLFNEVIALYAAESIRVAVSQIVIWQIQDSFIATDPGAMLTSYQAYRASTGINGDLGHLLSCRPLSGGVAYLDALCTSYCYGVSTSLDTNFPPIPTFSWSVDVITHELGHNLGSRHTHWCGWPGGAIDNCGPIAGYPNDVDQLGNSCPLGPAPINGGTIMSYCHLTSYGINFSNGFGPYPGDAIRTGVANASCVGSCSCPPSVSLTQSPAGIVCSGTCVTFTATPTNGGTLPTYVWYRNGVQVSGPTSQNTFSACNFTNGTRIYCEMTSNAPCAYAPLATSNFIDMVVVNTVVPVVTVTSSNTTICTGDCVSFQASVVNGGSSPTYTWKVNGTTVATGSAFFTSCTLSNGQTVTCQVTSNFTCASPSTATSSTITITVTPSVTPVITITANATQICNGTPVTFTAYTANAGISPQFNWQINRGGIVVYSGITSSNSFTTSNLQNNDQVNCQMTSSSPCANTNPVASNSILVAVNNGVNNPTAGLLAWYPFNGDGLDYSGNGFHGTFQHYAYLADDRFNAPLTALGTEGGGEHLEIGNPPGFNTGLGNAITVSAWVYMAANNSSQIAIVSKWNFDIVNDQFLLWIYDGKPNFAVGDGIIPVNGVQSRTILQDSVWYHLVGTWDNSGVHELYIDGQLDVTGLTTTPVYSINNSTNKSLNIGNETDFWRSFRGRIDEVRIYSRKLSPQEILNLYHQSSNAAIAITADNTIVCSGSSVNFSSNSIGTGSNPQYAWYIDRGGNTLSTGINSPYFATSTLQTGDEVYCIMQSSDPCVSPSLVASNKVRITVSPNYTLIASANTPSTSVCQGAFATATAATASSGYSVNYQWYLNNAVVIGSNGPVYNFLPNNNDQVYCRVTALSGCVSPTTTTTNSISYTVNTPTSSSISMAPSSASICPGECCLFTINSQTGQGISPTYFWKVNGLIRPGFSGASVTFCNLQDGDSIECGMVSSLPCVYPDTVYSNSVVMQVAANVTPSVSIQYSPTFICNGGAVTATATPSNGGSAPSYTWRLNGSLLPMNGPVVNVPNIQDGDVLTCTLTSNDPCALVTTATNSVAFQTASYTTVISANNEELCTDSALSYQWYYNGSPISNSNSPCIQAMINGFYQVVVSLPNGCVDTSALYIFSSTGLSLAHISGKPALYPNPSDLDAVIELSGGVSYEVEIFAANGQRVAGIYQGDVNTDNLKVPFSTASLSEGVYFIRVSTPAQSLMFRLAVIHE